MHLYGAELSQTRVSVRQSRTDVPNRIMPAHSNNTYIGIEPSAAGTDVANKSLTTRDIRVPTVIIKLDSLAKKKK